jgi:hypothetical protein
LCRAALRDQLARQGDQFAAIFDGINQRIEAANQEMADAEIVVIAEHFGDLFGRSDQCRGVAVGTGEFCNFGPEALIDPGALLRQREQSTRTGRCMTVSRLAVAGLVLQRRRARQDLFSLCPCPFLGIGKNGANRQAEAPAPFFREIVPEIVEAS